MILLSICDNADLLSAIKLANSVVDIFKIAVPILLILSIWFSIMGAKKTNNSELIKDAKKSAIFKVIAAVLIFIVPMIFNLTFKSDKYSECLSGVNDKNIAISYSDKVSYLAFVAYEENDSEKLKQAEEYLSKISDVKIKEEYQNKINDIKQAFEVKELIVNVRKSKNKRDYEYAFNLVKKIDDENIRKPLFDELSGINKTIFSNIEEVSSNGYVSNEFGLSYFNQCDVRWGSHVINKTSKLTSTMCTSGDAYASLAMIVSGYNDSEVTPISVFEEIKNNSGYSSMNIGDLHNNEIVGKFNIKSELLFGVNSGSEAETYKKVDKALKSAKTVIVLVHGNYIVLIPGRNGSITLFDSVYSSRNGNYSNLSTLKDKLKVTGKNSDKFIYAVAYSRLDY